MVLAPFGLAEPFSVAVVVPMLVAGVVVTVGAAVPATVIAWDPEFAASDTIVAISTTVPEPAVPVL